MKVTSPYKCDYCPALKKETNHWWMLDVIPRNFTLGTWDEELADQRTVSGTPRFEHVCSESCAVKALNKWMTERKTLHGPIVWEFVLGPKTS